MNRVTRRLALPLILLLAGSSISGGTAWADNLDQFPIPGIPYLSENGAQFGTVETEILSMSLMSSRGTILLPSPGAGQFQVDSFFDVFTEVSVDGGQTFQVDSFFDVFTELRVENTTKPGSNVGSWDTEIVSMDLTGAVGGTSAMLRESPSLPSPGEHSIVPLGGGEFQVDSFFDVFTELSVDGGRTWTPALRPMRVSYSRVLPEPATVSMLGMGALAMLCFFGRAMWTRRRKARTTE